MELREILNRTEGVVIYAKSLAIGGSWPEVRDQLYKLHEILTNELVSKPFEQPAPTEQPIERPTVEKAESKIADSKDGAGVVSEPAEQEIKDGAGVVSESEKSQTRDGSGIS